MAKNAGVNSGFMIAHVTAAALGIIKYGPVKYLKLLSEFVMIEFMLATGVGRISVRGGNFGILQTFMILAYFHKNKNKKPRVKLSLIWTRHTNALEFLEHL